MSNNTVTDYIDNGSGSTYTGSVGTDRLMFSFWGIRICIYIFFFIINSAQAFHEAKLAIKRRELLLRFMIFTMYTFFTLCRIVGDIMRYVYPYEYGVGSWYYFFFSWGVFFVITGWVFIAAYWMQLLYTFYSSDEINFNNTKRVKILSYVLVLTYAAWQTAITILCIVSKDDYTTLEAAGFFVFFIAFGIGAGINGAIFVKVMRNTQKKAKVKHFSRTILNTKILIATAVISVVVIVVHDVIFNFILEKRYYYFPVETFMTMFIDVGQMIVVMVILGNRNLMNYLKLRKVKTVVSTGPNSSNEIDLSNKQSSNKIKNSNALNNNSKLSDWNSGSQNMNSSSKTIEVSEVNSLEVIIDDPTPPPQSISTDI